MLWRTPVPAGTRLPLVLRMPEGVRNLKEPVVRELADSLVERRWIDAGRDGLAGGRIEIVGLQLTITDVLAHVQFLDGRTLQRGAEPQALTWALRAGWTVPRDHETGRPAPHGACHGGMREHRPGTVTRDTLARRAGDGLQSRRESEVPVGSHANSNGNQKDALTRLRSAHAKSPQDSWRWRSASVRCSIVASPTFAE